MTDVPDPSTTAVLFVECQNGLLSPEHTMMHTIAKAAEPMVPAMGRLARGARAAGTWVAHLTYVPMANNRSTNRRPPLFARLNDSMDTWTADHPATQVIPEIGVGPDDMVLVRHTGLSPTYGTETFNLLRNIGVRTIVFAGISANVALPVAGTEAVDEDFDVVFARDAIAGAPPEHVESMLRYTLPFIGTMASVDDLVAAWRVTDAAAASS